MSESDKLEALELELDAIRARMTAVFHAHVHDENNDYDDEERALFFFDAKRCDEIAKEARAIKERMI